MVDENCASHRACGARRECHNESLARFAWAAFIFREAGTQALPMAALIRRRFVIITCGNWTFPLLPTRRSGRREIGSKDKRRGASTLASARFPVFPSHDQFQPRPCFVDGANFDIHKPKWQGHCSDGVLGDFRCQPG